MPLTCLYPANRQPISRAYCFLIGSLLPAYCELIVLLLKAYLELIGELIETCRSLLGELIETWFFPIKNSHKRRFNLWGAKVMICFHSCNTSGRKTIIFLHFQCIFLFSVRQQYDIYRRYARERYDNSTTYSRENASPCFCMRWQFANFDEAVFEGSGFGLEIEIKIHLGAKLKKSLIFPQAQSGRTYIPSLPSEFVQRRLSYRWDNK